MQTSGTRQKTLASKSVAHSAPSGIVFAAMWPVGDPKHWKIEVASRVAFPCVMLRADCEAVVMQRGGQCGHRRVARADVTHGQFGRHLFGVGETGDVDIAELVALRCVEGVADPHP